jgi:alpha-tubulin suppressor-like RCC1 family protein
MNHWGQVPDSGDTGSWGTGSTRYVGPIEYDIRPISIAAGYKHSAVVTEDGELLTCGSNRHGQCGVDGATGKPKGSILSVGDSTFVDKHETGHPNPYSIYTTWIQATEQDGNPITDAVSVAVNGHTTMFIREDGTLWGFGRNMHSLFYRHKSKCLG